MADCNYIAQTPQKNFALEQNLSEQNLNGVRGGIKLFLLKIPNQFSTLIPQSFYTNGVHHLEFYSNGRFPIKS